jgi:hypothetical protein
LNLHSTPPFFKSATKIKNKFIAKIKTASEEKSSAKTAFVILQNSNFIFVVKAFYAGQI